MAEIDYNTDFKDIREAIKTAVDEQVKSVQKSYTYERSTFSDGYPAMVIVPTDNEADYGSTQKDRVVFVFKLKTYYEIKKEGEHDEAEGFLEAVVDETLTRFRDRAILGSACDWVEPAPSIWYYEERSEGVYRVAEITLRCVKYLGS